MLENAHLIDDVLANKEGYREKSPRSPSPNPGHLPQSPLTSHENWFNFSEGTRRSRWTFAWLRYVILRPSTVWSQSVGWNDKSDFIVPIWVPSPIFGSVVLCKVSEHLHKSIVMYRFSNWHMWWVDPWLSNGCSPGGVVWEGGPGPLKVDRPRLRTTEPSTLHKQNNPLTFKFRHIITISKSKQKFRAGNLPTLQGNTFQILCSNISLSERRGKEMKTIDYIILFSISPCPALV